MNVRSFSELILSNKPVFILDENQEIVLKVIPNGDKVNYFVKHKGRSEIEISHSSTTVSDAIYHGDKVTEEYYERF